MSWRFYTERSCAYLARFFRAGPPRPRRDVLRWGERHGGHVPALETIRGQTASSAISQGIQAALSETLAKLADMETQRDRWRDLARSGQMRSAEMRAEIDQLTAATVVLGRERDEWRALTAHKSPSPPPNDASYRRKFTRLRAVVVKSLHPDHGAGSQEERVIRGEIFKQVWPEIERIESDA